MLTREDLENDALRKHRDARYASLPLIPEAEFNASLERILAGWNPQEDLWLFAYGSLIWNPLVHFVERAKVTVHGFHRSFCLVSRHGRGSVDQPGLMLALDYGGSCKGVALKIKAAHVRHELTLVWRREMAIGSYTPRWVSADAVTKKIRAVAFVVNHAHSHYAGKLPLDTVVKTLATAKGRFGSGADYLYQTVDCLSHHGIRDSYLVMLRERVAGLTGDAHHAVPCPETGA